MRAVELQFVWQPYCLSLTCQGWIRGFTCDAWNLDSLCTLISFTYSNFLLIPCNFNLGECHTIISRKPNEHCKILHYEMSKSKKAFSFRGPQNPWPEAVPLVPALPPDPRYRLAVPHSPYLGAPLKFVLAPWPQVLVPALVGLEFDPGLYTVRLQWYKRP